MPVGEEENPCDFFISLMHIDLQAILKKEKKKGEMVAQKDDVPHYSHSRPTAVQQERERKKNWKRIRDESARPNDSSIPI
ncbi:hypothetical protein OUZ56_030957 [Daphnia magna]|uniref:Uncharacterized protein n=1 Tax=Daphnia magna TaxID=35525 RepID=A0ABQ9ZST2_9CRUS|nr:hypothetical protein OUZ56_030957 [Daphnia magna]